MTVSIPRLVTATTCFVLLSGCGQGPLTRQALDTSGSVTIHGDVWADNWFAMYVGDDLLIEDSVSIKTERSFNAESFSFKADYPIVLNFVVKDFKQDESGLEYIGTNRQQLGDGGFIAQFKDASTGKLVATTDAEWKCMGCIMDRPTKPVQILNRRLPVKGPANSDGQQNRQIGSLQALRLTMIGSQQLNFPHGKSGPKMATIASNGTRAQN